MSSNPTVLARGPPRKAWHPLCASDEKAGSGKEEAFCTPTVGNMSGNCSQLLGRGWLGRTLKIESV